MKMTYGKLVKMQKSLKKIMSNDLDIEISLTLAKIIKEFNIHMDVFNEVKNKIVKKYTDEKGKMKENTSKDFTNDIQKLQDSEIDFNVDKIKVEILKKNNIKVSPLDIDSISDILED